MTRILSDRVGVSPAGDGGGAIAKLNSLRQNPKKTLFSRDAKAGARHAHPTRE